MDDADISDIAGDFDDNLSLDDDDDVVDEPVLTDADVGDLPSLTDEEKPLSSMVDTEEEERAERRAETQIDGTEDLEVQRDQHSEFTHAKFLNESRVAKRFEEQIRPIMAKTYPFELDSFQKQAIVSMEANDSVFVAAHTSAGKTVVAEYAIALSKIHRTRVIYTSPIKALSNQKFREFKLLFGDVGLITGDIQLNTDASCLIMTTEVLRSMLYNGSEIIRELEWVIFDEVHYINDTERGYVWEESLIMLPSHVSIVMLSATVPNCVEFADWVGRIKKRQITVIQTLKRPVPLEHFIYTGHDGKSREELFLLMDKDGNFLKHAHKKALEAKSKLVRVPDPQYANQGGRTNQQRGGKMGPTQQQMLATARAIANGDKKKSNYATDRSVYFNLIAFLRIKKLLPAVVFVFSRKRCDDNANMMLSNDLTTQTEKHEVMKFFDKCIDRLNGSDKILPQVIRMKELCVRGFAVHHSGILPILKEVVELLFQRGFVKILFATETFAMGVNMPARTVVFDSIDKFDGANRRPLNATEYTQMAGRAGRRGLDATGIVITLIKKTVPPITAFTQLLTGSAVNLDSQFRITYAMLLKLLRVEEFRIEDMLQNSYVERASLRLVLGRKKQIAELSNKIESFPTSECEKCSKSGPNSEISSLDDLCNDLSNYFDSLGNTWRDLIEMLVQKQLTKGRVILINYPPLNLTGRLAAVLNAKKNEHGRYVLEIIIPAVEEEREAENLTIRSFLTLSEEDRRNKTRELQIVYAAIHGLTKVQTPERSERSYRVIYDFDPAWILAICKSTLKIDVETIIREDKKRGPSTRPRSPDRAINKVLVDLEASAEKWSFTETPVCHFIKDIKLNKLDSYERVQRFIVLQDKLSKTENYPCRECPSFEVHLMLNLDRSKLAAKLSTLQYQTSNNALILSDEYKNRLHVLRMLGYICNDNLIDLKGKVGCEINHLELLTTELLFDNKFDGRSCAEIAAMLSTTTCQFSYGGNRETDIAIEFKHESNRDARDEIIKSKKNIWMYDQSVGIPGGSLAHRIDAVQNACQVFNSPILEELRFGLMDVVYEWAEGTPFSDIMLLTTCQEGLIVRCIQRLDEVLKDIRNAARIIGNDALYEKMEETSECIKRDIVFAASLYTSADA